MRFQTKIIMGYAVFVLGAALILGFSYYRYNLKQYEKTEKKSMEVTAQQMISQMDEMFKTMELTMQYILSDYRVLSAIRMLSEAEELNIEESYQKEAVSNIQSGLRTDFIVKNFHRTIVFNRTGNAVASMNVLSRAHMSSEDFEGMVWLKRADAGKGKPVIANAHEDTWGIGSNPQVFSLIKAVQGNNMGYIEVQKRVEEIGKLIQLPKEDLQYAIFVNGNELLYANFPVDRQENLKELELLAEKEGKYVAYAHIETGDGKKLVAKEQSEKYDIAVLLMENLSSVKQNSAMTLSMTFGIAGVFFVISMLFVILISTILTKPIRELRKAMEDTQIENLGESMVADSAIDEIKALNVSYRNVLDRLQISMLKEKKMAMLQLQAQFDTLQSQVNPHFLYNVLNIIAARGMSNHDEGICNMCASLASMLRYSTNTKTRYAVIREELSYLEQYFYLQKARYEHRIVFEIRVSDEVKQEIIPKMSLQQIVENCINHAFENMTGQMVIHITGWRDKDRWYCKVADNGQGMEESRLELLKLEFEKTKSRILKLGENIELEIGGMGLVNTYARLLLLYNDELVFKIQNVEAGLEVIIGAPMRKERHVSSIGSG